MLSNVHLNPTKNQTAANGRPEGIPFVKLTSDIRSTIINPKESQPYPFSFLFRLVNESRTAQNSGGTHVILTTFHAPDNWAQTTDQIIVNDIWNRLRRLGKPFDLVTPTTADINNDAIFYFLKS